jgi:putative FmdB family regulatory protein
MPLYEYHCEACGRRFELIRKFSDPPLEKCPTCDGAVRKLVSSPAFQFKGSGWYITDYAKKEQPSAAQTADAKSEDAASKEKDASDKGTAKSDKADKGDKADKTDKSHKTEKSDKAAKSGDAGSKSESTPAAKAEPAKPNP